MSGAVTLRIARAGDEPALAALGRCLPDAPLLLAEVAGRPVAALSLRTGDHVAEPSAADLVALLRARAHQLTVPERPRRAAAVLRAA